jgi:hypothetical protein
MSSEDRPFQFPAGFHLARLYPVEGDSAIAELWHGDDVWADLRLDGIRMDEHGEQRVTGVRCVLRLYPPPDGADPPGGSGTLMRS